MLQSLVRHDPSEYDEPEISVRAMTRPLPVQVSEGDLRGEWFGDYLLVGELAVGGMAEVFLGVKQGLAGFLKVVVIKRVLPQFTTNPEFVRMFVDEARLAARLEHPNIVRTHEFGEVDGQYFTVMEYLPGEDLSKVLSKLSISRQRMPLHVAAGVASQVCAGLQFAHQLTDTIGRPLNLVHRDIAPGNILITYGGEVKVIDFGVAKTTANTETVAGTIKGKIAYMAPEQLLARGVDQRSDVFSIGAVLWEMLTGQPLFLRGNEAATMYAVLENPIAAPSTLRGDVPRQLDAIVGRALARTPADRYGSAAELGAALEDFLHHQPRYDARAVAELAEGLFGSTRAEAKRSIAQTRSLATNISKVMKLRTDVRCELGAKLEGPGPSGEPAPAARPQHRFAIALIAIILGGAAGLGYVATMSPARDRAAPAQAHGTVELTSTPSGAAVFVGDPTGLQTPATLSLAAGLQVSIRVALADHDAITETLSVAPGATVSKHLTLAPSFARLVISDLPADAVVLVDGEEHLAGEVIAVVAGTHDVRVIVAGQLIARQSLVTAGGLQAFRLAGTTLQPNQP